MSDISTRPGDTFRVLAAPVADVDLVDSYPAGGPARLIQALGAGTVQVSGIDGVEAAVTVLAGQTIGPAYFHTIHAETDVATLVIW